MHTIDIPVFATPAIVPDVMTPAPQPELPDDTLPPRPSGLAAVIDLADLRDLAQALLRRYHKVAADDDINQTVGRILSSLVHAAIDDLDLDWRTEMARNDS